MPGSKRQVLYDALVKDGYDLGDFDSFSAKLDDPKKRRILHFAITKDGYDVGDLDSFELSLLGGGGSPTLSGDVAGVLDEGDAASEATKKVAGGVGDTGVEDMKMVPGGMVGGAIGRVLKGDPGDVVGNGEVDGKGEVLKKAVGRNGVAGIDRIGGIDGESSFERGNKGDVMDGIHAGVSGLNGNGSDAYAGRNFLRSESGLVVKDDGDLMSDRRREMYFGSEEAQKRQNKVQVGDLLDEIEEELKLVNKEGVDKELAYFYEHPILHGLQNVFSDNSSRRFVDEKRKQNLLHAKKMVSESSAIIDEANRKGNTNFFAGAGRGFANKAFDLDTWAMGISKLLDVVSLEAAAKKADRGEVLGKDEEMLLTAAAVNMATQAYFSSDLGRGYKAGQVTAESIPFMLEFVVNPASAAGKGIAKSVLRYGIKRFGKEAMKSAGGRALRIGSRVAGDVVGAGIMSVTTGFGNVAADAVARQTGQVKFGLDEGNNAVYAGRYEGDSAGMALVKAFGASTIENYSEMFGNYLSPLVSGAMRYTGLNRLGAKMFGNAFKGTKASKLLEGVKKFERSAQWHGTIGEYAEEQVGMLLNALTVEDSSLSDFTDMDRQIDTFLGVSLMGGFFSGIKSAAYLYDAGKGYVGRVGKGTDDNGEISGHGIGMDEGTGINPEPVSPYEVNRNLSLLGERFDATCANPKEGVEIRGLIDGMDMSERKAYLAEYLQSGASREQKRAVMAYVAVKSHYDAMISGVHKEIVDVVDENREKMNSRVNLSNGQLVVARMVDGTDEGRAVDIVSGLIEDGNDYVIVAYEDVDDAGNRLLKREQIGKDRLMPGSVVVASLEERIAVMEREVVEGISEGVSEQFSYSPEIPEPLPGIRFVMNERELEVVQVTPDEVLCVGLDNEGNEQVVPVSVREFKDAYQDMISLQEGMVENNDEGAIKGLNVGEEGLVVDNGNRASELSGDNGLVEGEIEKQISFMDLIDRDDKGNLLFEESPVEVSVGALKEIYDDVEELIGVVEAMINSKRKRIEKHVIKPTGDIQRDIANKRKSVVEIEELNKRIGYWEKVLEAVNGDLLRENDATGKVKDATLLSDVNIDSKKGVNRKRKGNTGKKTAVIGDGVVEEGTDLRNEGTDSAYGASNGIVTREIYEELRGRLREKLSNLNVGFDPEIFSIGTQMAMFHMEAGARKFADFAERMINDFGDQVRPYLKSFYEGARLAPGMEVFSEGMDSNSDVIGFDIDGFLREGGMGRSGEQEREKGIDEIKEIIDSDSVMNKGDLSEENVIFARIDTNDRNERLSDTIRENEGSVDAGLLPEGTVRDDEGGHVERISNRDNGAGERNGSGIDERGNESDGSGRDGDEYGGSSAKRIRSGGSSVERKRDSGDRGAFGDSVVLNGRNFRIGDVGSMVPKGEISKIRANIKAIELLKKLESKNREASPEEKKVLSQYSGWGGLAEVLNRNKVSNENWKARYLKFHEQLIKLLTLDEFTYAVNSTINAHYTSGAIVSAVWVLAERLGFKGGSVLEPAMGTGNFFGLMPGHLMEKSSLRGYELDSITGRIARMLYPDASIRVEGYEHSKDRNIDLIITNVPFGQSAPYDKGHKDLSGFSLHNYFIGKGIKQLAPNGIGLFITSMSSMDAVSSGKFRQWVTNEGNADLIGAIRLPNNAFQDNAGTQVTTDILVFKKRDSEFVSPYAKLFRHVVPVKEVRKKDGTSTQIEVNEYFAENPDMLLGELRLAHEVNAGGLYSGDDVTLHARKGYDLSGELDRAIRSFPENVTDINRDSVYVQAADTGENEGTMILKDGLVYEVMDGELVRPLWVGESLNNLRKKRVSRERVAVEYLHIKDVAKSLIDAEREDNGDIEELRKELNRSYDAFVKEYGQLNNNLRLRFLIDSDIDYNTVFALEKVSKRNYLDEEGKAKKETFVEKADIFFKRVLFPVREPTSADSLEDALEISLAYHGRLDLDYIAGLTDREKEDVRERLIGGGLAFVNPQTGILEDRDSYLSGYVRTKYREAVEAAVDNPVFERNVEALKGVVPDDIPGSQIKLRLGSPFIPGKYVVEFVSEFFKVEARIGYRSEIGRWVVDVKSGEWSAENRTTYGSDRMTAMDLLEKGLNLKQPEVFDIVVNPDGSKSRVKNFDKTAAAQAVMNTIGDEFVNYVYGREDAMLEIERLYNEQYNDFIEKSYSVPRIKYYPNASSDIELRKHQKRAVSRALRDSLLLAHQVGTGKTFTMQTVAMEMRRLGIAKKPMIVVQNATLEQFVMSFKQLYPGVNLLAPTKKMMDAKNRQRLFSLIAYGDYDAIIIPQSFVDMIPDDPERQRAYIREQIGELELVLSDVDEGDNPGLYRELSSSLEGLREQFSNVDAPKVKDLAKRQLGVEKRLSRQADRRTDHVLTFEQMGIDALLVDEAHAYKKLGFFTKMSRIKGIDTGRSKRAFGMFMKVQFVQEKTGGKNVIFATGTPITNTMAEVWTMMKFVSPDVLDRYSIGYFDEFASTFGSVEPSLEFTATGSFKIVERFKSYINAPELLTAFRVKTDVVLTEDIPEFKESNTIPKLKGGAFSKIIIPQGDGLVLVMDELKSELKHWENLTGREKKEKRHVPLLIFNRAKQAAIDLRLLNPNSYDDPGSKTNRVVDEVMRIYGESRDYNGTQLIFSDMYQSPEKLPGKRFNLYEDIRGKLIERGIPAGEIAIINNYEGAKRELLFDLVNKGDVRVVMGSTERMGVGVNIQRLLGALHHVDAPPRPMDFEQRNGRILRQGNEHAAMNIPVEVVTYGVAKTLDATAYQRLAIKQRFINQMMKGEDLGREIEDSAEEDSPSDMTFDQMMSTLSGSQYAMLHVQRSYDLKKLETAERNFRRRQVEINKSIKGENERIDWLGNRIKELDSSKSLIENYFSEGKVFKVGINDRWYVEKLGNVIDEGIKGYLPYHNSIRAKSLSAPVEPLRIYLNDYEEPLLLNVDNLINNEFRYGLKIGEGMFSGKVNSGQGLLQSVRSKLMNVDKSVEELRVDLDRSLKKIPILKEELKKPFDKAEKLDRLREEVADLEEKMKAETTEVKGVDEKVVTENDGEDGNRYRFAGDAGSGMPEVDRIVEEIGHLSYELNTSVRVIRDREEIVDENRNRERKKRESRGWYDGVRDEVIVVLPNVLSVADARATVLHEVVGHKGMAGLLGKERFDRLCERIMDAQPEVVRRVWIERYRDKVLAGEEYMACLAEKGCDVSTWEMIRGYVRNAFRGIGIDLAIKDSDLLFLLWKSKNRLMRGDSPDVVSRKVVLDERMRLLIRFRGLSGINGVYERALSGNGFRFQEAFQDSMLALKRLQEVVELYSGKKLKVYENAYVAENQLGSKNTAECEVFLSDFYKPLLKCIASIMEDGTAYEDLLRYIIAKHGLERNEVFAERDAEMWFEKHKESLDISMDKLALDDFQYESLLDMYEKRREELYKEYVLRDYSGLSGLLPDDESDFKGYATILVNDFEHGREKKVDELWELINAATKKTLRKGYESGLMSKESYVRVKGMFKFYVPLRGWNEEVAGDVFAYFNSEVNPVNSVLKSAKGRESLADDPIATIGNMAESTILQGNRNLMKQHFLNMVINRPTDIATIREVYCINVGSAKEPVWQRSFPDIKPEANADEIAEAIREHDDMIGKLMKVGLAKRDIGRLDVGYRIMGYEAVEHAVVVKRNGKEYVIYINGNPRAAQALNGLTNPDASQHFVFDLMDRLNRQMAANFTTRNPAFVLSNLSRDLIYALSSVDVKEEDEYVAKFVRNIPRAMAAVKRGLFNRGKGNKAVDVLFREFIEYGGETGHTALHNVEQYKKLVRKELKKVQHKTDYWKGVRVVAEFFSGMNRWAEDVSRFNTFLTSREMGRSVVESIRDAKEITVNFNKKGAGYKTGGVIGASAGFLKNLFLFYNAGVQGLYNFSRNAKSNPVGFAKMLAGFTWAGFMIPAFTSVAIELYGDDDERDAYDNLPEWVRRNNFCIYVPGLKGKFVTIPLPIELRAFYGIGELCYQVSAGNVKPLSAPYELVNQLTDLLPVNPMGQNGDLWSSFTPDAAKPFVQIARNRDFFGKPIYRENSFNEGMPEWTKVYSGTSPWMIEFSEVLNELGGGDKYTKSELGFMDINPAKVEHVFEGYFGGMAKTVNQMAKTLTAGVESVVNGEMSDDLVLRNVPVVNRFVSEVDDRNAFTLVNQLYHGYYDEFKRTERRINGYKREMRGEDAFEFSKRMGDLMRKPEYRRYYVFKVHNRKIHDLLDLEKRLPGVSGKKKREIVRRINGIKKGLVDELEGIE